MPFALVFLIHLFAAYLQNELYICGDFDMVRLDEIMTKTFV